MMTHIYLALHIHMGMSLSSVFYIINYQFISIINLYLFGILCISSQIYQMYLQYIEHKNTNENK